MKLAHKRLLDFYTLIFNNEIHVILFGFIYKLILSLVDNSKLCGGVRKALAFTKRDTLESIDSDHGILDVWATKDFFVRKLSNFSPEIIGRFSTAESFCPV